MWTDFSLFPPSASTFADSVDALYFVLIALSLFFSTGIFVTIFVFAIRYRRRSEDYRPPAVEGNLKLELTWSLIPLGLAMVIFVWGATLYFSIYNPPADAMEIYVVGKQWMWKVQHPQGKREINSLHVPIGQPVRLTMTSEDVIHDFFIPAFRVKMDVLPGRYTTMWFEATKAGVYHLFCAEYCGTKHSKMIGQVIAMEPADYSAWLGGESGEPMEVAGERLFQERGCATCHRDDKEGRGPALDGLFGETLRLQGGGTVVMDEGYIRESILNPNARLMVGYKPLMPAFAGQISEEGILQLIAYIKSLGED